MFSKTQFEQEKFSFTPFLDDTKVTWIDGVNLNNEKIYVPISMVYVNYRMLKKLGNYPLPKINAPAYAGISAGYSKEFAIVNALQEIMERHATMCWWHNPPYDKKTKLEYYPNVQKIIEDFEKLGNSVSVVGIKNRFRLPIYAVTLFNKEHGIVNTGFACRLSNENAILKALTEAATLQSGSFDLLNENRELFKAIKRKELSHRAAKPWRSDRRYLDYYDDHFSNMEDLMLQQQVYLDQRLFERVKDWLFPKERVEPLYADRNLSIEKELELYKKIIQDWGLDIITIDVTTPDVSLLNF